MAQGGGIAQRGASIVRAFGSPLEMGRLQRLRQQRPQVLPSIEAAASEQSEGK